MSAGGEEKTEKPTGKRLADARSRGQVPRTADLGAWLSVAVGVFLLPRTIGTARSHLEQLLTGLDGVAAHPEPALMTQALVDAGGMLLPVLAPLLVAAVLVEVVSHAAQGGLRFSWKGAKPSFKPLNPITGVKNLFQVTQLWQMGKSLVKTAVIGLALWMTIHGLLPVLLTDQALPLSSLLGEVQHGVASLVRTAVAVGLVMAAVDYAVSRWKTGKDLKMTKQEVKDEHKSSEGNPQVKAAIKSKQRELTRNRMMAAVATADVVLVNPTHVAVALRYEAANGAPRVVAKGSGHVAARIRQRATENGVPMVADVPLARALFAACELGQEVPEHLFVAVAQVLAFVMALRRRGSAAGLHRSPVAA